MATDISQRIRNSYQGFSKGQKKIANAILNDYDKAAYMTAAKLGSIVNVSESTVVRFAIELGFEGYPELQHALQEMVRTKLTSVQRMEVTNSLIGDGDVLGKVLLSDADKIKRTLEEINREDFFGAVDDIAAASNIYVMGARSSASLAGFLSHNLGMIFDSVKLVQTSSSDEMFEQMLNVGEGDVLIAISFPRYSKKIIHAVNYAKSKGARVIAITDSQTSPIAMLADRKLLAKSDMASFVDSLVAPLSIINAIIVAVARKNQDALTQRLRRLEEIWDEYEVYDQNLS
jgi:DNA-binding MurR/RpiR family transcriptional regulator